MCTRLRAPAIRAQPLGLGALSFSFYLPTPYVHMLAAAFCVRMSLQFVAWVKAQILLGRPVVTAFRIQTSNPDPDYDHIMWVKLLCSDMQEAVQHCEFTAFALVVCMFVCLNVLCFVRCAMRTLQSRHIVCQPLLLLLPRPIFGVKYCSPTTLASTDVFSYTGEHAPPRQTRLI